MDAASPEDDTVLETERLVLRRWRVPDATVRRTLWAERDPRVPPHRRLSADGRPALEEFEAAIQRNEPGHGPGLLAVVEKRSGEVIGSCGLLADTHDNAGEPELAYEFVRAAWGQGYATEAATAVIDEARMLGHRRVWATIRDWNGASRRLAERLGFAESGRVDPDAAHGDSIYYRLDLDAG